MSMTCGLLSPLAMASAMEASMILFVPASTVVAETHPFELASAVRVHLDLVDSQGEQLAGVDFFGAAVTIPVHAGSSGMR
jgi:hypothetical protein